MIILIILSILTVSCAAVSAADVDDVITDVQSDSINLEAGDSDVDIIEASEADQDILSEAVDDGPVLGVTPATGLPIYDADNNWSDDHIFNDDAQPTDIGRSFLDHIEEVSAGTYYHHSQHPLNLYYTSVRNGTMYLILDMGGNYHFKTISLDGITGLSNDYEIINDLADPNGNLYTTICLIRFDHITGTTSNGGLTIQMNQRPKVTVTGIKIYNDTETILYVNDKKEDTIYLGEDATLKANVVYEGTEAPVTSGTVYYYLYSVNGTKVLDMETLPDATPLGSSAPGGTIPYLPDAIGDYEFIAWYPVDDSGHNGESHSNLVTLHVIEPPKLDLKVNKTANVTADDKLVVGDYVKFTITVTNLNDTVNATGVVVNDKLPTGLRFVSSNDTAYDSSTGDWTVGKLNAGESKVLEIVAQVTTVNVITNTATLTACRENDTNPGNNVSSVILTPHTKGVSLALTKEVSNETPLYGSQIDYTITVINLGSVDAHDIEVTDKLPNGLTYVTSSDEVNYDPITGVWNVGTINAGENKTLTITVKVESVEAINNTANITGHSATEEDPVKEDDGDSVVINPIPVFDLELHKSIMDSAEGVAHFVYGSEVVYTIVITNNGPCAAKNVIVKDLLPAGLEFVSATDSNYDSATGKWTVGDLANNGGSKTLNITAIVKEVGSIVNLANITDYDGEDSDLNNNDESVEIIGDPKFDLGVSIEVINPEVLCGQTIKYIITVVNNGPCAAYNVEVTDILPSIFIYVSSSSSADAQTLGSKLLYASELLESASGFDQSTGKWAVGDLNNGDEVQLEIIAEAVEVGDGTITGSVSSDDFKFDTDDTNNEYAADVKVLPCADLSIEKSVDKTEIKVGETVTYTITVTNNGPNDATGVKVTDEDITKHTFVSASDDAYDSSTGVWTVGDLSNGESKTLTVTVKITEVGEFANTATVSGNQDDNDPSNNEGSSSNVTVTETEDPDDPVDPVDPEEPAEPAEPAEEIEPVMPKAGNPILALLLAIILLTGVIFERKE